MRKSLSCLCFVAIFASIMLNSFQVSAAVPLMATDPIYRVAGMPLKVVYNQAEVADHYTWYLFPLSDIAISSTGVYTLNATANYTAAKLASPTIDTITIPADAGNKFIYCEAQRADNTVIQQTNIFRVVDVAPAIPAIKRTIYGFENVPDGVNMGIAGSDIGPTALRRANGMLWNPNALTWSDTTYSTFTGNYQLNSVANSEAPEGSKTGKWINKVGETLPAGTTNWSSNYINFYMDDPQNTYNVGATEFSFWLDATNYFAPTYVQFSPILAVVQYDANGKPMNSYLNYQPSIHDQCYFQDVNGNWVGRYSSIYGVFSLPPKYKGYVRILLDDFVPSAWSAGAPAVMQLNNCFQMNLVFMTFAGVGALDSYCLIDDLNFAGDNLLSQPLNYYSTMVASEGYSAPDGVVDEVSTIDVLGGTKTSIKWDAIGDYSKKYNVNLYRFESDTDEEGTYVQTVSDISTTGFELTGLLKDTNYGAQVVAFNEIGEMIATYELLTFKTLNVNDITPTPTLSVSPTTAPTGSATPTPISTDENPETGDSGLIYISLLLVLAFGIIKVISKKKYIDSKM